MNDMDVNLTDEFEACGRESMLEIKFDALVSMYEQGFGPYTRQGKPQWFKIQHKFTLEMVRSADPYNLGIILKQMLEKLDKHIQRYEGK